ncbi:MAG TPA: 16S rRNA (cytosine(967)-C(5))-methyltransferase RsmB [Candidatus Hydrogenedentes bacterium]|nr:16S rRNA (cytosine(967)-C(5))-methyltransferase RsmB [Candidatus Hydrogenedentota bacterium]HQH54312.1 16S rRNA (cytosine(967)-C(5))-methyltransferase RsmB [Candidatus Hydrogenedentota bacterium]
MPIDPVRNAAIDVLLRVFEQGVFLDVSLDRTLRRKELHERGRRFLTHLVYGTVRHRILCDYVLRGILRQPLEELPAPIRALLRMGIFQSLFCSQVTPPALVHTSVDLARKRGHAGLARLTNAVLRRAPHELSEVTFPEEPLERLHIQYSMPEWLVKRWLDDLGPNETEALCRALTEEAPISARVNTLQINTDSLLKALQKGDIRAEKRTVVPEEITFFRAPALARSKRFQAGDFTVQDPASMLPAHLLEPQPGERILDMCAAPGNKTTHIAALAEGRARLTACDIRLGRIRQIRENMTRLNAPGVHLVAADGRNAPFVGRFDRVLVDAPCSGLGTLRRHPDLKYRLSEADIRELALLQQQLLRSAIVLCENQGVIVYSVCTSTPEETEHVVAAVLATEPVTLEDGPIWMSAWRKSKGTYRTNPVQDGLDGFFLTRLRKQS